MKQKLTGTATLLALALALALAGCSAGSKPSDEPKDASDQSSTSSQTSTSQSPASKKEVPSYKGKTLHAAITDLRERKVGYKIKGPGFEQSKEVAHTREWIVEKQEVSKDGKSVTLTVAKKSGNKK